MNWNTPLFRSAKKSRTSRWKFKVMFFIFFHIQRKMAEWVLSGQTVNENY